MLRGLKYHVRSWGEVGAPKLFLVHGWQDQSASFQFLVDALKENWHVLAPDFRGSGLTQWAESGGYWFSEFLADLNAVFETYQPEAPVNILAHSMGFNVASILAGVRPQRVRRLVNVECYGFRVTHPDDFRTRYAQWLEQLPQRPKARSYASFAELQAQLQKGRPQLPVEHIAFLANNMARPSDDGRVTLLNDPWQKSPANKMIYVGQIRDEEAMACWRNITAPVLWVQGDASDTHLEIGATPEELAARKACFRDFREERISGASHMIHQEAPEHLAGIVEPFLR